MQPVLVNILHKEKSKHKKTNDLHHNADNKNSIKKDTNVNSMNKELDYNPFFLAF